MPLSLSYPYAKPPWTQLGKTLESMCRKALYTFNLIESSDPIAVALSGGKDSLTLLFLLHAILGRGFPPCKLYAVHVQGEFSCGAGVSTAFLQGICDALNVPLLLAQSSQRKETLACYSCSRQRRSAIFTMAKSVGATTIAFGHHREDSILTLLMNTLHKAEFAANLPKVPMHDYGITLIRPLIYVPEEKIRSFAQMYGFARITCQCPVGQHSMRQTARLLLEEIEKSFPNARENLFQAALRYGSTKALHR